MEILRKEKLFLIASIIPQNISDQNAFKDIKELKELVDAFGGKVVEFVVQHREVHDKGSYLGKGKLEEIGQLIKEKSIDVIVLNATVKPGQIHEMKRYLEAVNPHITVWDRIDLILEIFSNHAHTTEAKLQIELAAMRHMGPRIFGMGYILSRQGGSIGTRGIGETNTELMKRHWRNQMKKTHEKLKKLEEERSRQLERRRRMGLQTISIVGYTNAGKTSLFNALTKKRNFVQNALFATLDASVGKLILPESGKKILVSDTIGFIKNLPPSLVDAFTSTLMESIHADILLHAVDSHDDDLKRKISAVEKILHGLNVLHKKTIMVFNKEDLLSQEDKQVLTDMYKDYSPVFISSMKGTGLNTLCQAIETAMQTSNVSNPQASTRMPLSAPDTDYLFEQL